MGRILKNIGLFLWYGVPALGASMADYDLAHLWAAGTIPWTTALVAVAAVSSVAVAFILKLLCCVLNLLGVPVPAVR